MSWWVHFSNYFPREVESVHQTKEEAEKRRDELNEEAAKIDEWPAWEVEEC